MHPQKCFNNKTTTENPENSKIQSQFGKNVILDITTALWFIKEDILRHQLANGQTLYICYLFSITVRAYTRPFLLFYFLEKADEFMKVHNNVTQTQFHKCKKDFIKCHLVIISCICQGFFMSTK